MSCLHTISGSPHTGLLDTCLSMLRPGDALLFLEDGTYYCAIPDKLASINTDIELFALKEDMLARGTTDRCAKEVKLVGYSGFVQLCCDFDKIVSWF